MLISNKIKFYDEIRDLALVMGVTYTNIMLTSWFEIVALIQRHLFLCVCDVTIHFPRQI